MEQKHEEGAHVASRLVLWALADRVTNEDRQDIRARVEEKRTGLLEEWGNLPGGLSPFQKGFVDELERINFRLGQPEKSLDRDDPAQQHLEFFCIKCGVFATGDGPGISCPSCHSLTWLEVIHFPES